MEPRAVPDSAHRTPAGRSTAREYFTVDLRGLRAALSARANADGITESEVLRSALAAKLGPHDVAATQSGARTAPERRSIAKLSIRVTHLAAHRLDRNARAAGLSRGTYLTHLIDGAAPVVASPDRVALASALKQSAGELAVLSRDIHHLTELLRRGSVEAARQYRSRLDTIDADVRMHLERSGKVLAELSLARLPSRLRMRTIDVRSAEAP